MTDRPSLEDAFVSQLLEQLANVANQDVVLSSSLIRVIAWAFGEWFLLASDQASIIQQLFELLKKSLDSVTQVCIHNALTKILSQTEVVPDSFIDELDNLKQNQKYPYNWICNELDLLCTKPKLLHDALCSDDGQIDIKQIQIDEHLSFLDEFVAEAIADGAPSYDSAKCGSWLKIPDAKNSSIKYHAYEQPEFSDLRDRDFKYGINSPTLNSLSKTSLHSGFESTRVSEDMPEPSRSFSMPEAAKRNQQRNGDVSTDRSFSLPNPHYDSRKSSATFPGHHSPHSLYNESHSSPTHLRSVSQSMYMSSRERRPTQERGHDLRASLPNVLETKGGTIIRHDLGNSGIIEDQIGPGYHTYQSGALTVHLRKTHQPDLVTIELTLQNVSEIDIVKFQGKAEYESEQLSSQWEIRSDVDESEITSGPEVEIPLIKSFGTVSLHLGISISSEIDFSPISVELIATYLEQTGATHVFQTECDLLVTDFLRPWKITLKEFNSHWDENNAEVKKHLPFDKSTTFQEIAQKMANFDGTQSSDRRLHLIEITDERVSVAGQTINQRHYCLIRFQRTSYLPEHLIEMRVRSSRPTLAKLVARDCKPLLS
ncbi:hypothetical protein K493DRAFT_332651 [Basidiobolus meristosporus CBS 931.73]|uniref:AP-4 complex subunit epsilon-1 C-terminal domain-containing protein n=1 Tax=Basidiobolus meristosporus CBS 931.73 TaxID=1314790 RepID=A0A1Y1ZBU0_9FUNG|nr:hypothetical protein K493DRAFT_332651 [Basidiobolus meristosporus CBS 931.73]|eukprot:ORY07738.1 hypothetical protein K493DRAFT_332651 [Basidiobolus meristosporus CBS 931.73]